MPDPVELGVASPMRLLLNFEAIPLLACCIVFTLWAIWNLCRPPGARWILAQVMLSLVPGVIALVGIYATVIDFAEMAQSQMAPKPSAMASVINRAMSFGFWGLLAILLPVFLGAIALLKKLPPASKHDPGENSF